MLEHFPTEVACRNVGRFIDSRAQRGILSARVGRGCITIKGEENANHQNWQGGEVHIPRIIPRGKCQMTWNSGPFFVASKMAGNLSCGTPNADCENLACCQKQKVSIHLGIHFRIEMCFLQISYKMHFSLSDGIPCPIVLFYNPSDRQ